MGAKMQRGTRIKLKFSDGASIEWRPLDEPPVEQVLREIERLVAVFEESPDSGLAVTEESLAERGRKLASQREDLIAAGVDPRDLLVPLHPVTEEKNDD